ncbi:hypothetical protein, partial [Priestia megaterium]|uniref:hypothetical protein n=1 Tax=Priestia megaterium TaxID=1404 RepID=UPI001BAF94BC
KSLGLLLLRILYLLMILIKNDTIGRTKKTIYIGYAFEKGSLVASTRQNNISITIVDIRHTLKHLNMSVKLPSAFSNAFCFSLFFS